GIKPMGVKGVGIATLIDRILMMAVMAWYVLNSSNFKRYIAHFSVKFIDFSRVKKILKIGAPVAMQYVFEIGAFAGAALIAGRLEATDGAAHQTAITLGEMTDMMGSGTAVASSTKVGTAYGNKNSFSLPKFARVSYRLGSLFMIICALIFAVFN